MSAPVEPPRALMSVVSSWPVEKYARFVQPSVNPGPLPLTGEEQGKAPNSGSWQTYSFKSGESLLCLLQGNHLLLRSGGTVLESFSLADARQWLKGVTKGDSMLFMCKLRDDNRRFRVKFAATAEQASLQTCRSCCDVLEAFFPIKDASHVPTETTKSLSQYVMTDVNTQQTTGSRSTLDAGRQCFSQQPVSMETSKPVQSFTVPEKQLSGQTADTMATIVADVREIPLSTMIGVESGPHNSEDRSGGSNGKLKTTSQILQEMMVNKVPLGQAYAECFIPEEDLRSFIRLCLTDQSFPGFVDQVDKELGNILS